jgi:hypothetical protein
MAIPMVKSTYVLDVETADRLERLARDWHVSKSEALRRAIRSAADAAAPDRLTVFRQLQSAVTLNRSDAASWAESVRAERRAQRSGGRRK